MTITLKQKRGRRAMIECGYYNMDCLDGMELIEDKTIDMILCDLPYGTTRNASGSTPQHYI